MTIGTSYIAIREKDKLSVCAVGWLWAMDIFQSSGLKGKKKLEEYKRLRKELRRILRNWHTDDKTDKKYWARNEKEMIKKFEGDTYGIIEKDGTYLSLDYKREGKNKVFLK